MNKRIDTLYKRLAKVRKFDDLSGANGFRRLRLIQTIQKQIDRETEKINDK